ncbi:MAG: hypothetical protein WA840_20585 [Caulobacteraceae bacterium]
MSKDKPTPTCPTAAEILTLIAQGWNVIESDGRQMTIQAPEDWEGEPSELLVDSACTEQSSRDGKLPATEVTIGQGRVDISPINWNGKSGVLISPREHHVPLGEVTGEPREYSTKAGDVVIWIDGPPDVLISHFRTSPPREGECQLAQFGPWKLWAPFSDDGIGTELLCAGTAYLEEYVFDDGECSSDYEPTEHERMLMLDAFNGMMADERFWKPIGQMIDTLRASPSSPNGVRPITLSIRDIQSQLPWTIRYSTPFRDNPQPQKDFSHTLLHIAKAHGKLSGVMEDADHHTALLCDPEFQQKFGGYVADYVICAMRLANVFPGGPIDLQEIVESRLEQKNGVTLDRSAHRPFDPVAIQIMNTREGTGPKPDPRKAQPDQSEGAA